MTHSKHLVHCALRGAVTLAFALLAINPAQAQVPKPASTSFSSGFAGTTRATGTLEMVVYNDLNASGSRESGEPGLAGWNFQLSPAQGVLPATSSLGMVTATVPVGSYTVTLLLKVNFSSIGSVTRVVQVSANGTTRAEFGVVPPAGTGGNNAPGTGQLIVKVNKSTSGSGTIPLSGWQVTVTSPNLTQPLNLTTVSAPLMTNVTVGNYTVVPTVKPGWVVVGPAALTVPVTSTTPGTATFGFRQLNGTLQVTYFHDKDQNGLFGGADTRLGGPNFKIALSGGIMTQTAYIMPGWNSDYVQDLPPGTYTVTVTPLQGTVTGGATRTVVIADGVVSKVSFPVVW